VACKQASVTATKDKESNEETDGGGQADDAGSAEGPAGRGLSRLRLNDAAKPLVRSYKKQREAERVDTLEFVSVDSDVPLECALVATQLGGGGIQAVNGTREGEEGPGRDVLDGE
jgi:hypothetical protein